MAQLILLISKMIKIIPFYIPYVLLRPLFSANGFFQWLLFIIVYTMLIPIIYYILMFLFGLFIRIFNFKYKI